MCSFIATEFIRPGCLTLDLRDAICALSERIYGSHLTGPYPRSLVSKIIKEGQVGQELCEDDFFTLRFLLVRILANRKKKLVLIELRKGEFVDLALLVGPYENLLEY